MPVRRVSALITGHPHDRVAAGAAGVAFFFSINLWRKESLIFA